MAQRRLWVIQDTLYYYLGLLSVPFGFLEPAFASRKALKCVFLYVLLLVPNNADYAFKAFFIETKFKSAPRNNDDGPTTMMRGRGAGWVREELICCSVRLKIHSLTFHKFTVDA